MATIPITTAAELLRSADLGRCELWEGELVMMSPASFEHGRIVGRVHGRMFAFVDAGDLGVLTGAETGFQIQRDPDTVLAPDVAFIAKHRIAKAIRGFFPGSPDLAVEVLSRSDRRTAVREKVQRWLGAGCRLVWILDPNKRSATVHRADGNVATFQLADELDGEDVLPGFRLALSDVFAL